MRTTVAISGDAPARRMLTPTGQTDDQGRAVLRLAGPGDLPVGTSGSPGLSDGAVTPFEARGRPVWTVEAGEALEPGSFVAAGEAGRAVVAEEGDPYAVAMCLDPGTAPSGEEPGALVRVALLRTVSLSSAGDGAVAWSDITGRPSTFPPSTHEHTAAQISDATEVGRGVLTADTAAAARSAIGAGTSSQNLTAMTAAEAEAGTSNAQRGITAAVLAAEIDRRIAAALETEA